MNKMRVASRPSDGLGRFRSSPKRPKGPFIAAIGGAETYGRFMDQPYPTRLARGLAVPVVNLGLIYGGLSAFQRDPIIRDRLCVASAVVIECPDHRRWSNAFYRVHPKRSDRITTVLSGFYGLFPGLDVQALGFVEQFWGLCRAHDPGATQRMERQIRADFSAAFQGVLKQILAPIQLVSFSDTAGSELSGDWPIHRIVPNEKASLRGFKARADEDRNIARAMAGQMAHDNAARSLTLAFAPRFKRPAQDMHGPLKQAVG